MRSSNEKFSLALCGGGGKGAYQIGVWKALTELDMAKDLEAVSGTSVGALNAVLIALGDFENAQRIWKNIRPETLLSLSTSNEQGLFTREGLFEILNSVDLTALKYKMDVFISVYDVNRHCTLYKRINDLKGQLDSYGEFYCGLIDYTGAVCSASEGAENGYALQQYGNA